MSVIRDESTTILNKNQFGSSDPLSPGVSSMVIKKSSAAPRVAVEFLGMPQYILGTRCPIRNRVPPTI